MDIKNLIIALLAAALGVATLEATNVIDLLNNNGVLIPDIKVNYVPSDSIKTLQAQKGKPICSSGKIEGYYFSADEILALMLENQTNPTEPTQTLKGILVYPYRDNTGELNLYLGVPEVGKYVTPIDFCPFKCKAY